MVYRLYDVGYGIDLDFDRAAKLLESWVPERARPTRGEAQALQIPNPPLTVVLDPITVEVRGDTYPGEVSARIFDFGTVSLRVSIVCRGDTRHQTRHLSHDDAAVAS